MQSSTKKVLIAIIAVTGTLLAVYLGFAHYFSTHFPFRTTLNGNNITGMTVRQVKEMLLINTDGYVLTIEGKGGVKDTIDGAAIKLTPVFAGEIEDLISDDPTRGFGWMGSLVVPTNYRAVSVLRYSEEALDQAVDSLAFFQPENVIEPTGAELVYEDGEYKVLSEDDGVLPEKDQIRKEITEAVIGLKEKLVLSDACYGKAEITS